MQGNSLVTAAHVLARNQTSGHTTLCLIEEEKGSYDVVLSTDKIASDREE